MDLVAEVPDVVKDGLFSEDIDSGELSQDLRLDEILTEQPIRVRHFRLVVIK